MKSNIKRISAFVLAAAITVTAATPAPAQSPAEKDEVVYINLNSDGSINDINVINAFDLDQAAAITDYGKYTEVKNLTTTDKILVDNDTITVNAPKGKFYYQGKLKNKEIPWNVSVRYMLDGKPISGEKLAGSSGHLSINVSLKQNKKANPVYLENFALQATVSLDSEKCKNITSADATIANVGNKKQLSYIILPNKEKDFSISADVSDFEMDGIQINGIPLSISIDDPDTTELMDKVYDLQDGAVDLDDGAVSIDDGVAELKNAILKLNDGTIDLQDGAKELYDGADELNDGASKLYDGSSKLFSGATELKGGFDSLNNGSTQLLGGIATFQMQAAEIINSTGGSITLANNQSNPIDMAILLQNSAALGHYLEASATQLNAGILQLQQQISSLGGSSNQALLEKYSQMQTTLANLTQLKNINALCLGMLQYVEGAQKLSVGYSSVYMGIGELKSGIVQLYDGTQDIKDGTEELYDGTVELNDGVKKLYDGVILLKDGTRELSDGTNELRDETSDMNTEVDDKIDEMLDEYRNKDFKMVSFVSEKNKNIDSVQFVIKTAEIKAQSKTAAQPKEPEKGTILSRIEDLFSFLKKG